MLYVKADVGPGADTGEDWKAQAVEKFPASAWSRDWIAREVEDSSIEDVNFEHIDEQRFLLKFSLS